MPDTNDKIKALYNAASQKFDIGSEQEFRQKLTDPSKRKSFYDAAASVFDLGTYDEYEKKLGPTQKSIDEGIAMAAKVPSFKEFAGQRGIRIPRAGEITIASDIAERVPSLSTKANIAKDVEEAPERIRIREEKKELAKVDALKNNTTKALKASGVKFTEGDAVYKKMQESIKLAIDKGAMTLSADAAGKPIYKRSSGIVESFINNVEASRKDIKDSEVFRKSDDAESIKIAEERMKVLEEESVPSGTASEIAGMLGSAAPILGRAIIGGSAVAKLVPGPYGKVATALGSFLATISPSYDQAYTQSAIKLYAKGKEEIKRQKRISGLSEDLTQEEKEEAMRAAKNEASVSGLAEGVFTAGLSAIPLGAPIAGQSFKKALINFAKNTAKEVPRNVTLGAASEVIKDVSARNAGYNITTAETLDNVLQRSGQDAITTLAFEVGFNIGEVANVPKYVKAAANNYLSTIPTLDFNNFAKDLEGRGLVEPGFAEKATADVSKFNESKAKVASFISEEDMPSFAGLIEKKTNLENQKKSTDPSFHAKIDEQIAAVDERIKKMQESPNPILDEVDELTGDTGDAVPVTQEEIEKSIEYADGFTPEIISEKTQKRLDRISEIESIISNDDSTFYETGNRPLLKEARVELQAELQALKAEQEISKKKTPEEVESLAPKEQTPSELRDVESTTKALEGKNTALIEASLLGKIAGNAIIGKSAKETISEAYHADKATGKETDLTKSVESLFPKEQIPATDAKAEIERFRAEEQKELASAIPNIDEYKTDGVVDRNKITNEEDLRKFDEIYDKYDKLITPLLEAPKEALQEVIKEAPVVMSPEKITSEIAFSSMTQKELMGKVNEIGELQDPEGLAMKAFLLGAKVSEESYKKEFLGRKSGKVKRRGKLVDEARATTFTKKEGQTIPKLAHRIWEGLPEDVQRNMDDGVLANAIIEVMNNYDNIPDLRLGFVERFYPKEMSDADYMNFLERNKEEVDPINAEWESWMRGEGEKEMALELDEAYVNELIKQYEQELTGKDAGITRGKEERITEEVVSPDVIKKEGIAEGGSVKKYIDEQATPEESTDFSDFSKRELGKEGFDAEYKSARVEGETKEQYLVRKYCK